MANTHSLFKDFYSKINLADTKKESLKTSRNALRLDIKNWFSDKGKNIPRFCWQGSFAMKTVINPIDNGEYDLDDGIYLQGYDSYEKNEWPTTSTVHSWVKDAVKDRTKKSPIDKDTCIRVSYAAGYHIDLPIYIVKNEVAYLAHKTKDWIESDPKAFKSWFIDKVKNDTYGEQLRRVVKFLKAWKDFKGIQLKGIEITILATENFEAYTNRDDKAILNTIKNILTTLENKFSCVKPVAPWEDLFGDASDSKKNNIINGFKSLKSNVEQAIDVADEKTASKYLKKSFGDRFPLGKESRNSTCVNSAVLGVLNNDGRSA